MSQPTSKSFDPHKFEHFEFRCLDFVEQFLRMMEVGGREPVRPVIRVPVLSVVEVLIDDPPELEVEEKTSRQAVKEGSESAYCRSGDESRWTGDSPSLSQCPESSSAFCQVIERAEEKNHVERAIRLGQISGITNFRRDTQRSQIDSHPIDVTRRQVDHVDLVTIRSEPRGMNSRSAPNVQDASRWRR